MNPYQTSLFETSEIITTSHMTSQYNNGICCLSDRKSCGWPNSPDAAHLSHTNIHYQDQPGVIRYNSASAFSSRPTSHTSPWLDATASEPSYVDWLASSVR